MQLRMWMYDLAREQSPTLDNLRSFCRTSLESGYNALGIYLEHRYAYPSAPWAAGKGALQPSEVAALEEEFPELQIIPFVNLLGHMEGFLYTDSGQKFAEEPFVGMQACPSNPAFVEFAKRILEDVVKGFKSDLIHIGGDEAQQLGKCPQCRERVKQWERTSGADGKALLYGEHFRPMADLVLRAGKRPATWGDMFLAHPQALEDMPKEMVVFDWQYFRGFAESAGTFQEAGHEVVLCPTLHVYDSAWLHLLQSEQNVYRAVEDARAFDAMGVCLTTWENGLFAAFDTLMPAIRAAGSMLQDTGPGERREPKPLETLFTNATEVLEKKDLNSRKAYAASPDSPAARLLDSILELAHTEGARKVRIEKNENAFSAAFSLGTVSLEALSFNPAIFTLIADRAHYLAGLDLNSPGEGDWAFRCFLTVSTLHIRCATGLIEILIPATEEESPDTAVDTLTHVPRLVVSQIPSSFVDAHNVIPIRVAGTTLIVACTRQTEDLQRELQDLTGWEVQLVGAPPAVIEALRGQYWGWATPHAEEAVLALQFDKGASAFLRAYGMESERYEAWARTLGIELQGFGTPFLFTGLRSSLKCRFLLYGNPFLLWLHHREHLAGDKGKQLVSFLESALYMAPDEASKGVTVFLRSAVEFTQIVEAARDHYAKGNTEAAITKLALTRQLFDDLAKVARNSVKRIGGSLADVERCRVAKEEVERAIVKLRRYGDGSLGYIPAFEHLCNTKFMPYDQAAWWLINKWGSE